MRFAAGNVDTLVIFSRVSSALVDLEMEMHLEWRHLAFWHYFLSFLFIFAFDGWNGGFFIRWIGDKRAASSD